MSEHIRSLKAEQQGGSVRVLLPREPAMSDFGVVARALEPVSRDTLPDTLTVGDGPPQPYDRAWSDIWMGDCMAEAERMAAARRGL